MQDLQTSSIPSMVQDRGKTILLLWLMNWLAEHDLIPFLWLNQLAAEPVGPIELELSSLMIPLLTVEPEQLQQLATIKAAP